MCKIGADGSYPNIPQSTSRELLPSDNGDYAIHRVALERIPPVGVVSGSEYLYRISYTIGTNDMGSINSVDQSCQPPSHGDNNFNFCSVNSFELILRAGR